MQPRKVEGVSIMSTAASTNLFNLEGMQIYQDMVYLFFHCIWAIASFSLQAVHKDF